MYKRILEIVSSRASRIGRTRDAENVDADMQVVGRDFDVDFYLSRNADVARMGIDPLRHFCEYGWREMRDPNPVFSVRFYLEGNLDIRSADINPYVHYLLIGKNEGRKARFSEFPKTLAANDLDKSIDEKLLPTDIAEVIIAIKQKFDPVYYLQTYPEVANSGIEPIVHFCTIGWKEGKDPTCDFSVLAYLDYHHDVLLSGVNPFWHAIITEHYEGRPPASVTEEGQQVAEVSHTDPRLQNEYAIIKEFFDSEFYLSRNDDVRENAKDPIEHFLVSGWQEGRNPTTEFSIEFYLDAYPDIRTAGINPFVHYISTGRSEGRVGEHPAGLQFETLNRMRPLEETVKDWRSRPHPEEMMPYADLLTVNDINDLISDAGKSRSMQMLISIVHDNYQKNVGGVQFCVQREEAIASKLDVLYLTLSPFQPLPRLAHLEDCHDPLVSLVLSGRPIGVALMSVVTEAVTKQSKDLSSIKIVVHHFLGHNPEQIAKLVEATGFNECWVWLHDFFTLCPSYILQRNNVAFCGAPEIESNSCRLCSYGVERVAHQRRISAFFTQLKVNVIAPSQFTADFWKKRSNILAHTITVCPHLSINWTKLGSQPRAEAGRITVAFVGYPAPHKGWPVFQKIANTNRGSNTLFRFVYFGTTEIEATGIDSIPVQVTAADPEAMIRALATECVDLVLHWASCAETFSFSTFEAMAAGAYVLTNPVSGNVDVAVRKSGLGAVLADEEDLESFFQDGRCVAMVSKLRKRRLTHSPRVTRSDLSFSVLQEDHSK